MVQPAHSPSRHASLAFLPSLSISLPSPRPSPRRRRRPPSCATTPPSRRDASISPPSSSLPSSPQKTPSAAIPTIYSSNAPALLFPPSSAPLARDFYVLLNHPVTEIISAGLVLGQCLVFALQTVGFGGVTDLVLTSYERVVSFLFVTEYFMRWYSVGLKPEFLLTRTMVIDFCAVLVPMGLSVSPFGVRQTESGGLFVRALRFARVFQLQRVMEEEEMYNIFGNVPNSTKRLANVILTVFTLIYVSAGLFYDFENGVNPEVTNMFAALYWAINTLTTVGPGDLTPVARQFQPLLPSSPLQTSAGRFVSTCTVLIGAVLVPLQLSEIASAAMQAQREAPSQSMAELSKLSTMRESDEVAAKLAPFDVDLECPRCHLTVHQKDARYCRNCAELLRAKRFD